MPPPSGSDGLARRADLPRLRLPALDRPGWPGVGAPCPAGPLPVFRPGQFTVTTRTPLHGTKLPLRTWLMGAWFILQSDKGISSIRLAEALGVSQPTAWHMGHALRLLMARDHPLSGTVEIDEFDFGGKPRRDADRPRLGGGRKGQPRTEKPPALAIVQRPAS